MIYATLEDLAEYLVVAVVDLPTSAQKLLNKAGAIVKHFTLDNVDNTNVAHIEAMKQATCSQVEYWLTLGEDVATMGQLKSFSSGDITMDFSESKTPSILCDMSRMFLSGEGLLYRGLKREEPLE